MLDPEAMDPSAEALDTAEPQLEAASPGLGISDGIALVVLFVGVSMIPTLLSSLLHRTVGYSIGRGWQVVMVELLAGATLIPLGLRWAGLRFREACPLPPYPARLLPGIALASIGLAIVLGELESWLPGVEKFGDLIRQVMGSSGMLPAVLASCIAAPVVEELLCRGVMLRGLRVRRTAGAAILASALLFAAMHLNPWQGFIALPLGLAYGWLTLRTGSLLSSMLANNCCCSFLTAKTTQEINFCVAAIPEAWCINNYLRARETPAQGSVRALSADERREQSDCCWPCEPGRNPA